MSNENTGVVSIIVPIYKAEQYIEATISTVLRQTYTKWELLLVDDCSPDSSVKLINQVIEANPDRKIRLIRQAQNSGAAATRNRGIEEAKGRYIAFLDADDLWREDKLDNELQFMHKHDAGFVFSSYEFGDENAVPTGKMVRVPKTLNYKQALSRTVIFTSTVLLDTKKVPKELIKMPEIASEDTATWWRILSSGFIAYGLDQPLVIYRRPITSLSSDKGKAIIRIWTLYREVAGLSVFASAMNILIWAWRATARRVIDDTFRGHLESVKRFTVVQLSVMGLFLHTAVYAWIWFSRLYPVLSLPRISQAGFPIGIGIKLYFRGHLLILALYFLLLLFLSQTSGGMKTGYLRPGGIFSSEVVALIITNILTYFQLSLIRNWLLPVTPFFLLFIIEILIAAIWSVIADFIYRRVFPPRETLIIELNNEETDVYSIINKFNSRSDRFRIMKTLRYDGNIDEIKQECLRWYGCVVVCGGRNGLRKEVAEFCYAHYIRVLLVPKIGDILIHGAEQMDLFDTPILELKEYSIRWEARIVKRLFDLIASIIAFVLCAPYLVIKLIRGDRLICVAAMGKDGRPFQLYRFRSSISKAAMLINIINGSMSLVGPAPIEEKKAKEKIELNARYFYRYRVKPGIFGYSQMYRDASEADKLKMDIFYIQHFSLLNDAKLLLQNLSVH